VKLGELYAGLIKSRSDLFEIFTTPAFALTVFNVVPKGSDAEEQNRLTKDVYELVNKRGEIYITSSVVGGVYVIRVVSANPLAEEKNVRRAFEILVETTEEIRDGKQLGKDPVASANGAAVNGTKLAN
jgi:aromatic-L-amino-acid decarboxylase